MSASKPLLFLLFPAILAVPCALAPSANAQNKSAAPKVQDAALTKPAAPATSIAPRQSLPAFASIKVSVAPVIAKPVSVAPVVRKTAATPPIPAKATALRAALQNTPKAALSVRQATELSQPASVVATPPVARGRRAFGSAVSLSTSPAKPIELIPPTPGAPTVSMPVSAPVSVKALAPLPKIQVNAAPDGGLTARPSVLASREARAREVALARLDAQLAGAEGRLNRAQTRLTEGQRQLGSVNSLLQSAMLTSGGSGLHPFVRVAERYLGTPYVWGGESARGFDCSGFIMRVMRDLGYQALPHSAAEQFNYGQPIAKGLLQPGDIVFFANTYKPGISHVGIYLGGGRFIHAANSQVGTIVSNLNTPKWIAHYAGARRLMKMN